MDISGKIQVPAWDLPSLRQALAVHNKVDRKLAFVTYGGLGDVLCCEPTVRYTCEVLKEPMKIESITVITRFPELFSHLPVETLQADEDGNVEIEEGLTKYHFLFCGHLEGNLQHQFFTHNATMAVDFPALSALRTQLPLKYRYIKTSYHLSPEPMTPNTVVVHPGNHWQSKRFPKGWWDDVLDGLVTEGLRPILIGGKPGAETGTVEVDTEDTIDLRGKLTIAKSASLLHEAPVLITNDSFPLHLATTGNCYIGFLATAKDPEWLMHWRKTNEFSEIKLGWRMENLALGGAYQRTLTPKQGGNHLSKATQEEVRSWLPKPEDVVTWALARAF